MKDRIIEYLYLIKSGEANVEEVIAEIQSNVNLNKEEIKQRATNAFKEILHSYEDFQVSTIDKFNLRLIRSFKQDLDISGEFEVVIDEKELHEVVVDLLLDKIGIEHEKELSRLMLRYAESNIEFGEQWNFRNSLIEFCEIVSKEKNKAYIDALHQQDFSFQRYKQLTENIKSFESMFLEKAFALVAFYTDLGVDISKFPGKSKAHDELMALGQLETVPETKSSGSLFNKTIIENCSKEDKIPAMSTELARQILELHEMHLKHYSDYKVMQKFRANFFNMALLKLVSDTMLNYQKSNRVLPISDFNKLIGNLVKDEYAPFIYERIGTRLEHFLLDEFQDTSRLQWSNLIPLIDESISYQRGNLIVGDPKQSIYRFNNGLAEQFIALPGIYNPENDPGISMKSQHFQVLGKKKPLNYNYRSSQNIVNFNNVLFENLQGAMNERAKEFYSEFKQNIKSDHAGYVYIESHNDPLNDSDLNEKVITIINQCLKDGFTLGDIAILTETKKEGNQLANFLTDKKVSVVSSDSILLKNSPEVTLIMAYLNLRLKPSDKTYAKRFCELYLRISGPNFLQKYLEFFEEFETTPGATKSIFNLQKFITHYFGEKEDFFFEYQSLYNLMVKLCKLLQIKELENPYVHHLLDLAFEFQISRDGDLKNFINYYKLKQDKLALQLPKSNHAVEILTIHKSKGLEFPVVLIPNLNFSLQNKGFSKFLVKVQDNILYTSLSKKSEIKDIADFTEQELDSIFIDKLNLAYVALTRPKQRLYGLISGKSSGLGAILDKSLSEFKEQKETAFGRTLELGFPQASNSAKKSSHRDASPYSPTESTSGKYEASILPTRLKDLGSNDDIRYGIKFHEIVSKIDFNHLHEESVSEFVQNNVMEIEFQERIEKEIIAFIKTLKAMGFINDIEKAYSEASILVDERLQYRPDLIFFRSSEVSVIELKTGAIKASHLKQVQEYLDSIKLIVPSNKSVSGYLYYTSSDVLTEVIT